MNAVIYSTQTCPSCKVAKRFLHENNVNVTEYKVDEDQERAEEMIKISGQMSVPVINIGGEIIIGFSPMKLKAAIGV